MGLEHKSCPGGTTKDPAAPTLGEVVDVHCVGQEAVVVAVAGQTSTDLPVRPEGRKGRRRRWGVRLVRRKILFAGEVVERWHEAAVVKLEDRRPTRKCERRIGLVIEEHKVIPLLLML